MDGLTITIKIDGGSVATNQAVGKPKKPAYEDEVAAIDNKLIISNRMTEGQKAELMEEVVGWVQKKLDKNDDAAVSCLLRRSKHHLWSELLAVIKDEIEGRKKK
jgi:hypothetical protein